MADIMRVGIGYDIHRLEAGRELVLGGVKIPFSKGLLGHSDADVLIHAIIDAILGAVGEKDIGTLFPDTDPRYKDVSSTFLLETVKGLVEKKYSIGNIDCIVFAKEPSIALYRDRITETLSDILGISRHSVSVKGKTGNGLGDIGEGRAIAAQAVVLLAEK